MNTQPQTVAALPHIYVFCNSCSYQWHSFAALAEDGTGLAGHVCSHHGFASGDMGVTSENKHDLYAAHYPNGYVVEYVEIGSKADVAAHAGLAAAIEKANAKPKFEEIARGE